MSTRTDRCLLATPLRALLLAVSFVLIAAPSSAESREEVFCDVLPPAPWIERVTVLHGVAAKAPEDGEEVIYLSWDGVQHELRRFRGRHVDLLLPPSWMEKLSGGQRLQLLRLLDYAWASFASVTRREPIGGSRAPYAVLDAWKMPGLAHARVGLKGAEFSAALLTQTIRAMDANALEGVWAHEMAHNFDVYSSYLFHAHAWTSFTDVFFTRLFLRQMTTLHQYSAVTELPEETLYEQAERFRREYVANSASSWETVIAPAETAPTGDHFAEHNIVWGRLLLEFTRIHGRDAILRWLSIVRRQSFAVPPPETAESRADFLLETLAEAAGVNTACYADRWRWYASPALRSRMSAGYGVQNAKCSDDDGDGLSELDGDCDDASPFVRSCSGLTTGAVITEGAVDFGVATRAAAGATIRGSISSGDVDEFLLPSLSSESYVQLAADPAFEGEVTIANAGGDVVVRTGADHGPTAPAKSFFEPGGYTLRVAGRRAESIGAYRLQIGSAGDLLLHRWAELAISRCGEALRVEVPAAALRDGGRLRVWADRVGFVPDLDDRAETVTWQPPADGVYIVSAVLIDERGLPVSALTESVSVPYTHAPAAPPCADRRRAVRR